jgi:acetolactate synthase-1/3 small subunit
MSTLELTVNNHPGVMSHVCGLFARRAFNVEGILCMPVGDGRQSRIWLRVPDDRRLEQMIKQLEKLEDVLAVRRHGTDRAHHDTAAVFVGRDAPCRFGVSCRSVRGPIVAARYLHDRHRALQATGHGGSVQMRTARTRRHTVKMRQVAVATERQSQGIGSVLVRYGEQFAVAHGYTTVVAHARESALSFYRKHGYRVEGELFLEVTIPHRAIRKTLIPV